MPPAILYRHRRPADEVDRYDGIDPRSQQRCIHARQRRYPAAKERAQVELKPQDRYDRNGDRQHKHGRRSKPGREALSPVNLVNDRGQRRNGNQNHRIFLPAHRVRSSPASRRLQPRREPRSVMMPQISGAFFVLLAISPYLPSDYFPDTTSSGRKIKMKKGRGFSPAPFPRHFRHFAFQPRLTFGTFFRASSMSFFGYS